MLLLVVFFFVLHSTTIWKSAVLWHPISITGKQRPIGCKIRLCLEGVVEYPRAAVVVVVVVVVAVEVVVAIAPVAPVVVVVVIVVAVVLVAVVRGWTTWSTRRGSS